MLTRGLLVVCSVTVLGTLASCGRRAAPVVPPFPISAPAPLRAQAEARRAPASVPVQAALVIEEGPLLDSVGSATEGLDGVWRTPFAAGKDGALYLLGAGGDSVLVFRGGQLVTSLPVSGDGAAMPDVSSVDVDGSGRLYCWDRRNCRIVVLGSSGRLLSATRPPRPAGDSYQPELKVTDGGALLVPGIPGLFRLSGSGLTMVAPFGRDLTELDGGRGLMQVADSGHLYYPLYFPGLGLGSRHGGGHWPTVGFRIYDSSIQQLADCEVPCQPVSHEGDPWLDPVTDCNLGADSAGFVYGAAYGARLAGQRAASCDPFAPRERTRGWATVSAYAPRTRAYFQFSVITSEDQGSTCRMRLGHDGGWYVLTADHRALGAPNWLRVCRYDLAGLRAGAPDVTTLWR